MGWISINFKFMKHKSAIYNVIDNALSWRYLLLINFQVEMKDFEVLKDLYKHDGDFNKIWVDCENGVSKHFILLEGYLFKGNWLCIPQGSLREIITFNANSSGLDWHFGRDKTLVNI